MAMTQNIQNLYDLIITQKKHRVYRKDWSLNLAEEFSEKNYSPVKRVSERTVRLLAAEEPVLLPGERITLLRTVRSLPEIFTRKEMDEIKSKHFLHEAGVVCNISPGYEDVIASGLEKYRQKAVQNMARPENTAEQNEFFDAVVAEIDAVYGLCERYRVKAVEQGNTVVADILSRVPKAGAKTFHEALQLFRIIHFTLWCEGEYHNTVGRFDQYIYPYFQADLDAGRLTGEAAYDLLLEFFLTFNRDSDLYSGVQQGDNGQSLVLGGVDADGNECFNRLSAMCIEASRELKLIDPKINLRVNRNTPHEIFVLGTELTKIGLGFPQYSNDDVVISGLVDKGYSLEDARDYVVAACWEFIIPKYGMDIPNIGALSFPMAVDRCMRKSLCEADNFDGFMEKLHIEIADEIAQMTKSFRNLWIQPSPFMSILMCDCIETGNDISKGGKYNNYGLHGTGLANAVDSLAAIRKYVFEEKSIAPQELIEAIDNDFKGKDEMLATLRYQSPKMGNNDDYTDELAADLLACFSTVLEDMENERGGCYRAGTGSAMYYLWHADEIGASPDGRRKSEPFSANYAPSLFAKLDGPLSVIQSFVKPDLRRNINGGPLTMEFHDTIFRDAESVEKVAKLVAFFIAAGGHQFQLNAVNRETLLDAQKHPEKYQNLIVRIWGWSAYFVELDKEYQDHVLNRQEYIV